MNMEQRNVAENEMVRWLSHPNELGKAPKRIEFAGEFDLHELHYYIFKYKKSTLGKWLVGVCGGFAENSTEHCGHIFSEMCEYSPDTAEQSAINMVERIRAYWMEQANIIKRS